MALQNIGASNRDDAFYRYKMPKLISKIEGRGNGIKTNLVNMVDVAKALCRPPSYTTKFFGCELGALSKFDEKTGTSIVNGSHDNAKLVALLEIFIKKYVQCYGCGNPETEIMISKSQMITMKCAACGFISDVDMRDKLTTFILKNPPEQKKGGGTKDKKALKKAEKEKKKKTSGQDETKKKTASASDEEQHSSPPLSQAGEEDETAGEDDDVEWQTDTSALAAQQRIKELSEATRGMVMIEEPVEPTDNESKKAGLKPKKSSDKKVPELSVQGKLLKVFQTCLKNGFTPLQCASLLQSKKDVGEAAMVAYFAALFGDVSKGLAKEVEKKRLYVAKAVVDEESQIWLLKAIEAFCCSKATLSKEVPLVLKYLYDEDILEEEKILEWYSNGVGKAADLEAEPVWEHVKPFVIWLRTAESESEEEELLQ